MAGAWWHPDPVVLNHLETGPGAMELEVEADDLRAEDEEGGWTNLVVPNHLETRSGGKELRATADNLGRWGKEAAASSSWRPTPSKGDDDSAVGRKLRRPGAETAWGLGGL